MQIRILKTVYKVTEGDECVIIELNPDNTYETINIRILAKSNIIERAISQLTKTK